jgi:hypothetical protein
MSSKLVMSQALSNKQNKTEDPKRGKSMNICNRGTAYM